MAGETWTLGMRCSYDVTLYDRIATITGVIVKIDPVKNRLLVRYDTPQLLPTHRVIGGTRQPRRLQRVSIAWIDANKAVPESLRPLSPNNTSTPELTGWWRVQGTVRKSASHT
jgi:hypothetical protein